jgi:hypothetical protein
MTFEMPSTSEGGIGEVDGQFVITDPGVSAAIIAKEEAALGKEVASLIETQKMKLADLRRFIGDKNVSPEVQEKITSLIDESQPLFVDSESVHFRKVLVGVIDNKVNAIYRDLGINSQDGNNTLN